MYNDATVRLGQIVRRGLTRLRAHAGLIQLVGVVVCLPPLIFPDHVPLWAIAGSLVGLVLVLTIGVLLAGRPVVRTPLDVPILLLLFLLPFNLLVTADRALTLPHVYKVVGSAALFYAVVGLIEEKSWFGLSVGAISVLGIVLGGILLFGTQWSGAKFSWLPIDLSQYVPHLINPFWKPEGVAGFNPNLAGGTLAVLLPVPVAYLFFGRKPFARLCALVEVGILSLILLFTQSRGAMAGLAVAAAAILVARDRRWLIVVMVLAIGIGLAWQFIGEDIQTPALEADAENAVHSAQGRMELWSRGLYMLQDFPFTGIGFGMVVKVMPLLYPTFLISPDAGVEHLHNLYLQAGADMGFPGLIVTLAFLMSLFYLCWRATQRARGTALEPLALGMLGVVVAFATHGLVETIPYSPKANLIIWALFGVAVAVWLHLVRADRPSVTASVPG